MTYSADPTNPGNPTGASLAGDMYLELQALKQYIKSLIIPGARRNLLINGQMNVDQILSGGSTYVFNYNGGGYTLDGWKVQGTGTSGTYAVQQASGGPFPINKCLTVAAGSGTSTVSLYQNIEAFYCNNMPSGTPVTVSGWININNPSIVMTCGLFAPGVGLNNFSTGVVTVGAGQLLTLTANTYTFFSVTFFLSAAATQGLQLAFTASNITGSSFQITNLQLEVGYYHSPIEIRNYLEDLNLCKPYFQIFYPQVQHYAVASTACGEAMPGAPMYQAGPLGSAGITTDASGIIYGNCTAGFTPYTGPFWSNVGYSLFIPVTVTTSAAYFLGGNIKISART